MRVFLSVFGITQTWSRWVPARLDMAGADTTSAPTRKPSSEESPKPAMVVHTDPPTQIAITSIPVKAKYELKSPYVLELQPFVEIGIEAVRPGPPRNPPPGHTVVCPSDRAYCIDYRASDNGTCMYPDPLEIKRCYDSSCINSPWNALVYKTHGENSYCKDFMTPAGRVCQWADNQACTCTTKSIAYYDAEFIPPGESIPLGFSQANPCTYPLDVIRKAAEEAARKARERKRGRDQKRRKGKRSNDDGASGEDIEESDDRRRGMHQRDDDDESANGAIGGLTGSGVTKLLTITVLVLLSI